MSRAKPPFWLRGLVVVGLWAFGWIALVQHGFSVYIGPWSQALVSAAFRIPGVYGRAGQEQTTVVLFREENLAALGTHYPVPYEDHALVLEKIASHQPKAILIDFAFIDDRHDGGIATLAATLCTLQDDRKIQLYITAPADDRTGEKIRPALRKCATPVGSTAGKFDPTKGVLVYPHAQQTSEIGMRPALRNAAFAMWLGAHGPSVRADDDMEIIWPDRPELLNTKWMKCGWPSLLDAAPWKLVAKGHESLGRYCPYSRTISVRHLFDRPEEGNSNGAPAAGDRKEWVDPDVRDALLGKTVFYGASFALMGDHITAPVFGELPGVYLHAMAYDNLVTLEEHYKRSANNGLKGKILLGLLLLVGCLILVATSRQHSVEIKITWQQFVHRLIVGVGLTLSAIVLSLIALGFGAGLVALVAFLAYLGYRTFVIHDWGLVAFALITVGACFAGYQGLDVGPLNILALLVFFGLVRKLQHYLEEFELIFTRLSRQARPGDRVARFLRRFVRPVFSALLSHPQHRHAATNVHPDPRNEPDDETEHSTQRA